MAPQNGRAVAFGLATVLLAAATHAQTAASAARWSSPEIWLGPSPAGQAGRSTVLDLLSPGTDWPVVKERLSGLKLYIDDITQMTVRNRQGLAQMVTQNNIPVTVECGGTLDFAGLNAGNGVNSANIELAKLKTFYDAGGKVDYLDMDGPIRRLLWPNTPNPPYNGLVQGPFTIETAADQLMNYMYTVKTTVKSWANGNDIRFNLLTNFPNWGYKGGPAYHNRTRQNGAFVYNTGNSPPYGQDYGDYFDVIQTVLPKVAADPRGIELAGLTVDIPYEYLTGERWTPARSPAWDPKTVDWVARVRDLEDYARSQGLDFNLIVNSETGGQTSNQLFYENTLRMLEIYMAAGGHPDRYIIQSWYPYPNVITPESGPVYSMTALAQAVASTVPEPITLLIFGAGGAFITAVGRR
jgi:hypothetical protein